MGRSVQLDIDGLILRLQHNQDEAQLLTLAKEASLRIQQMRQLAPGAAQQMCILTVLLRTLQEIQEKTQELADLTLLLERTKEENRFLREQIRTATIDQEKTVQDVSPAQQDMVDFLAALPSAVVPKSMVPLSTQRSLGRNPLLERQKSSATSKFTLPGLQNLSKTEAKTVEVKGKRESTQSRSKIKKKIIFEANGRGDSLFERQLNYWQTVSVFG